MNHNRALRDTRILVSKGLPPRRHRRLREHLRGCDDCLRHYERLRAVEDALTPAAVMSAAALERIGALVIDDSGLERAPRRGWAMLGSLATATALAVTLVLVMPRGGDDELTPRGTGLARTAHGLGAFIVDPAHAEVTRPALVAGRRIVVPEGKVVQLAYRNSAFRYVVVVGIDATYEMQWYHPSEVERASGGVALVAGAVDEPLPGAWSIDRDMTPQRLFAIFADAPIAADVVERAALRLRESGQAPIDVERLPGLAYAQDSLVLVAEEQPHR